MSKRLTVGDGEADETETIELSKIQYLALLITTHVLDFFRRLEPDEPYYEFEVKPGETEKVRLFVFGAFQDRAKWFLPLYGGILLGAVLRPEVWGIQIGLQSYGLILDIFGATMLALGLFRGVSGISRDTDTISTGAVLGGSSWYDRDSLSAVARNTIDGGFGAFYLISGFVLQIIAITVG